MDYETALNQGIFDRELSEAPEIRITGDSVSEETAKDFILKTDPRLFYESELEGIVNEFLQQKAGFTEPQISGWLYSDFNELGEEERLERLVLLSESLMQDYEFLKLFYLPSNFIYSKGEECGGYGIVNPNGEIYLNRDLDNFPTVESVYDELEMIASIFSELSFEVTLYADSVELPETNFVASFSVFDGTVDILDQDLHSGFVPKEKEKVFNDVDNIGIPSSWISETLYWIRSRIRRKLGIRI